MILKCAHKPSARSVRPAGTPELHREAGGRAGDRRVHRRDARAGAVHRRNGFRPGAARIAGATPLHESFHLLCTAAGIQF